MSPNYLKFDYEKFNDQKLREILSRFGDYRSLNVLYLSTYLPNYTRTNVLLDLFERNNVKHKAVLTGKSKLKYLAALYHLIKHGKRYDVIFVAFRGHEILPFIRMFTSRPIIFDAYLSMYDTICFDRKIVSPDSIPGRIIKSYERFLIKLSDVTIVDTNADREYFRATFGMGSKIDYIYIGCNKHLFRPIYTAKRRGKFLVFWDGSARPLQGLEIILKAAKLLEGEDVVLRLVGNVEKTYHGLINKLDLKNVDLPGFVPYEELPKLINEADLCLGGHFSGIEKAKRVIACKTFQYLACGKTVIVGDNPANHELFNESDQVKFVEMNSPQALADKIRELL